VNDSAETRQQLSSAWGAVLARLVEKGFPESACVDTMLETGLAYLSSTRGLEAAAAYLGVLQERLNAEQDKILAELGPAMFGPVQDSTISWSSPSRDRVGEPLTRVSPAQTYPTRHIALGTRGDTTATATTDTTPDRGLSRR
jgi:hypothetical protein